MEARTILLTFLVFASWTSTTTGQLYCSNLDDGSYCEHCLQPVDCIGGNYTAYPPCTVGTACIVAFGASYCTPHTQTECACVGTGPQCDAYNPSFIENCGDSGPFRVDRCSTNTTCSNDECVGSTTCTPLSWNSLPDCTGAYYCDESGVITENIHCNDGEYMDSGYDCVPGPLPACDGSCDGRCPNPVDCTKYFICDGTTVISAGSCTSGLHFDIVSNVCISGGTCTPLDGCDMEIGLGTPGTGGTTPSSGTSTPTSSTPTTTTSTNTTTTTSTTTTTPSTTTDGAIYTTPAPDTCNSSTANSKLPYGNCSQLYWLCREEINGQYEYVVNYCPGDFYFNTDASNPYCTDPAEIATCQ